MIDDPEGKRFVWYSPNSIHEVNIYGEGFESNYPDKFKRT